MPTPKVTVVVPTLVAGEALSECLESLAGQNFREFEVIVVDNSGSGLARRQQGERERVRYLENSRNVGFGAAFNQAFRQSESEFVATLNDDAAASSGWLGALVQALERDSIVGMCASKVLLDDHRLDSAGMLVCGDGSSKQRGHGQTSDKFMTTEEVFFPSGSAAIYRRTMLEEIGLFDEQFFLYCEDTDLGLRARWRGWKCLYVADAMVRHRYSHSAGRVSPLKAYFVERNRMFVIAKNFPWLMLAFVPWYATARFFWHGVSLISGHGAAGQFRTNGGSGFQLIWILVKAHFSLIARLPRLWRERRTIRREARISSSEFQRLARAWSISPREVAAL